jgi:hypothetical protein
MARAYATTGESGRKLIGGMELDHLPAGKLGSGRAEQVFDIHVSQTCTARIVHLLSRPRYDLLARHLIENLSIWGGTKCRYTHGRGVAMISLNGVEYRYDKRTHKIFEIKEEAND